MINIRAIQHKTYLTISDFLQNEFFYLSISPMIETKISVEYLDPISKEKILIGKVSMSREFFNAEFLESENMDETLKEYIKSNPQLVIA